MICYHYDKHTIVSQEAKMMEEEEEDVLFDQAEMGGGDDELEGDTTALLPQKNGNVQKNTHKYTRDGPLSPCLKYYTTFCLTAAFFGLVRTSLCLAK